MRYKILIVTYPKIGGCQFFRQIHPHENLAEHEFEVKHSYLPPDMIPNSELGHFDMVQLHKNFVTEDFLRKLKGMDIVSMVDFDDYWELPKSHPYYSDYKKRRQTAKFIEVLKLADYISATTDHLAGQVKRFNENVFVFPNAISLKHEAVNPAEFNWEQVEFGYFGGASHLHDVKLLQGINYKLSTSGLKYGLNLFGYKKGGVYDEYKKVLTTNGRYNDNLRLHAPLGVPDYLDLYNLVDVSLIPLIDSWFNTFKSELKLIEAGTYKRAVIVFNVGPYNRFVRHKKNALIVTSNADWYTHMKYCMKNPNAVKDMGQQLHSDINQTFNYGKIRKKREQVYRGILENRPA